MVVSITTTRARTSPNRFAGSDFLHSARIRISKKREAWGATLPAQGMGDAGGGYGPSLDRGLLLHPCAGAEGFGPAGATKGLSDRPLEAFGHHTWLELLRAKMPGGSSLASQLEEIGFFQQVEGETPRFEGCKLALGGPAKVAHGESAMDAHHAPLPLGGEQQKGLGKDLIAGLANVGLDPHAIAPLGGVGAVPGFAVPAQGAAQGQQPLGAGGLAGSQAVHHFPLHVFNPYGELTGVLVMHHHVQFLPHLGGEGLGQENLQQGIAAGGRNANHPGGLHGQLVLLPGKNLYQIGRAHV